jgi:hypothetical protein
MRAFAYLLRVYAGEAPECDADTAAFLAGMLRGVGRATTQQRVRGMTKEQADAAFLKWVEDQHALWGSLAAMENAPQNTMPSSGVRNPSSPGPHPPDSW